LAHSQSELAASQSALAQSQQAAAVAEQAVQSVNASGNAQLLQAQGDLAELRTRLSGMELEIRQHQTESKQAQAALAEANRAAAVVSAAAPPIIPSPPAGDPALQMKVAAKVQSMRTGLMTHRSRVVTDEEKWATAEIAFGNAVQQLLAMVHQAPKYSDGIYSVLGELRGILDTGKELVHRNRQLLDTEENALKDFEKTICE
jgi:hypothetical protein